MRSLIALLTSKRDLCVSLYVWVLWVCVFSKYVEFYSMLVVLHSLFVGRNTSYFCRTYHKQTSFLLSSVLISFDQWQNIAEAAVALEVWPLTDHCNSVLFVSMWCFLMEALQRVWEGQIIGSILDNWAASWYWVIKETLSYFFLFVWSGF